MTVPLKYALKVPANSAHPPAPFSSEKRTGILHTLRERERTKTSGLTKTTFINKTWINKLPRVRNIHLSGVSSIIRNTRDRQITSAANISHLSREINPGASAETHLVRLRRESRGDQLHASLRLQMLGWPPHDCCMCYISRWLKVSHVNTRYHSAVDRSITRLGSSKCRRNGKVLTTRTLRILQLQDAATKVGSLKVALLPECRYVMSPGTARCFHRAFQSRDRFIVKSEAPIDMAKPSGCTVTITAV
ncbi:hypothetical protein D9C73_019933 [Collichthys lucidus]|uniref:Uncharacterized protein n=1 Tax=Collichthys lucidus TaxID=240159 RepID=A0A4U5VC25_COLLU|nr:hypothetical protein D9C73_019933 [Collichthys lucidus]